MVGVIAGLRCAIDGLGSNWKSSVTPGLRAASFRLLIIGNPGVLGSSPGVSRPGDRGFENRALGEFTRVRTGPGLTLDPRLRLRHNKRTVFQPPGNGSGEHG